MKNYKLFNNKKKGIRVNLLILLISFLFVGITLLIISITFPKTMNEQNIVKLNGTIKQITIDDDYFLILDDYDIKFKIADQLYERIDKSKMDLIKVGDVVEIDVILENDTTNYLLGIKKAQEVIVDTSFSFNHWINNIQTARLMAIILLPLGVICAIGCILILKLIKPFISVDLVDYLDGSKYGKNIPTRLMTYISILDEIYLIFTVPLLGLFLALISVIGYYAIIIYFGVLLIFLVPYLYFLINNKNIVSKLFNKYIDSFYAKESKGEFYYCQNKITFCDEGLLYENYFDCYEDEVFDESYFDFGDKQIINYNDLDLICVHKYRKIGELISIYVTNRNFEQDINSDKGKPLALKLDGELLYQLKKYNVKVEGLDEVINNLDKNLKNNCFIF